MQGGVELDYQVDLSALKTQSWSDQREINGLTTAENNSLSVVEGLKKIIDKRVGSLGLSEPTIQSLRYGNDTHIIVQIPTESYAQLSDEDRAKRQAQDIANAKEVIGKVVRLEFKELRSGKPTQSEYDERKNIAETAKNDIAVMDPQTMVGKYQSNYERVIAKTGTWAIPSEAIGSDVKIDSVKLPFISPVQTVQIPYHTTASGETLTQTGFSVLKIDEKISDNNYKYSYVLVDPEPSQWIPAKTADWRILNDKYLIGAAATINPQNGQPDVGLTFNEEGAKVFSELTTRLVWKQIAIFVGGEMLTAPQVNEPINNGVASISGQRSLEEAKELATNITTGIVPAPIYLTSERTIDAKIWNSALSQILIAGAIGLIAIVVFLVAFYQVGGLLAGVALFAYALFLIAMVKLFWTVLTLASIAWVILSIGLAIDANILIFERIHEVLKQKIPVSKAINIWFNHSWSAIWDSHLTSFVSALILYLVGVSMIKGFGFMLGVGILLSLFTAMWISRILILFAAKFIKNPKTLVWYHDKK